jgi:hypothetical protein
VNTDIAVNESGGYEIRGRLCSDQLHTFVVCLSPSGVSPKRDRANAATSTVFTTTGVVASCVPLVGWALAIPFWLLGLLFGWRSDRTSRNHLVAESRLREAEQAADRPWRWWLTRTGVEPWPSVVTDDYQLALSLGIHHPARDVSGGWLITQTETSLPDAVSMARRVLQAFTY